ncbi:hypothetical protein NS506_04557 [Nocardia seriolae]|uniref:Uncharacterized protein n=1 Tax=Nocardia seriolae TaxID=37332 RepID=A0ABC8AWG6_9NOCA|nr:hypothetical protein NS506_04557 [Nocardia seriolae]BEK95865.1 hypothetical protein NSER024013_37710 [Nocardia seriolae]GEM27749.1 hypothetical protein NS2_59880 [Nocardia seriolae NBRC 15557]
MCTGSRRQWEEGRIRALAGRLGYDLRKVAVFGPETDRPVHRLRVLIANLGADAVIVPGLEHFENGAVPGDLVARADVITVQPERTFARWLIPPDSPADMGSR